MRVIVKEFEKYLSPVWSFAGDCSGSGDSGQMQSDLIRFPQLRMSARSHAFMQTRAFGVSMVASQKS